MEMLRFEMKGVDESGQVLLMAQKFGFNCEEVQNLDVGFDGRKTSDPYMIALNFFKRLEKD